MIACDDWTDALGGRILDRLDKADTRLENRLERLASRMNSLANVVAELSGQMKNIEKRLEEKDTLIQRTIELEIMTATEKLRAETQK